MKYIRNTPEFKERRQDLRRNQTVAEKCLWDQLRNKRSKGIKFYRQYSVGAYILDFYSPKLRLAIELDGSQHAEETSREYHHARTEYLKAHGIEEVRVWNNDIIHNIEGVLQMIAEKITPPDLPLV